MTLLPRSPRPPAPSDHLSGLAVAVGRPFGAGRIHILQAVFIGYGLSWALMPLQEGGSTRKTRYSNGESNMADPSPEPRYKRLLIKLSGEALMGSSGYGIDTDVVTRLARDINEASQAGCEIATVVGGGNIFRGLQGAAAGMDRANADYMGMLATVMNALALQGAMDQIGMDSRVLSAIPMPTVCESYIRARALHHLAHGRVVIFAAGTGNPFFTTDTAATLRAIEMSCDAVVKATQVDGVYSADPKQVPGAERYDKLSYDEVLSRDLRVMDGAAIALARDNALPVVVCSIEEPGNLLKLLKGEARSTVIGGPASP